MKGSAQDGNDLQGRGFGIEIAKKNALKLDGVLISMGSFIRK
jgi:hypothetical protein